MDGGVGHTAWAPGGGEGRSQAGPKGRQLEVGPRRGPRLLVLNITCFLPTLFSIMLLSPLVATHFYTCMLSVSFPRNLEIKMCVFDFMFDVFYQLVQIRVVPVFQSYLIKYPSRQIGLSAIKRIALNIWQFNLAFHMKCGRQEGRCTLSRPEKNAQQPFTDSTASSHFYRTQVYLGSDKRYQLNTYWCCQ